MLKGESTRRKTYSIIDKLSSGPGDDVLLAEHAIFKQTVVQKTVAIAGYEDAIASSEPEFLHRLDHPRITPVWEAQFDPDEDRAITFVMPHFAGGSVDDALKRDYRFSLGDSVQIAIDALDALAYLHREHNAIHRDTKPANLLLDADLRRGYLSDFGSAALLQADSCARAVLGTNVYRPPESRTTGRVSIDSDIYGIGLTLWEMVNGRLKWEELQLEVVEDRLRRGLRSVPDSQLEFEPHVPDRLRRAVRKMIQRSPGDRFRDAEECIRALRKVATIDWKHLDGHGPLGRWHGDWPPRLPPHQRSDYQVTSNVLGGGRNRGMLRLEADYRTAVKSWRQTVADDTIALDDSAAATRFFEAVQASAAHRQPTR